VSTADLAARLRKSGITVATAESCTGGLLSAELTSQPGSSDFMVGGVVAYSNRLKSALLGGHRELNTENGAVSCEVARAMAEGVREVCASNIGVAVTGVAGPDGSEAKPPGLIYVCATGGKNFAELKLEGDHGRDGNRRRAVVAAMELIGRVAESLVVD